MRRGSLPLDMSHLRDLLRDDREWIALGVVTLFPREDSHYEVITDELGGKEAYVDVKLVPNGEPCLCKLGAAAGGKGWGIWAIPPVGTEVIVAFPDGEIAQHPTIIRVLAGGTVPDGLDASTIVIAAPPGGKVLVHDGSAGSAAPLALLSDVQSLRDYVAKQFDANTGHTHKAVVPANPTPIVTVPGGGGAPSVPPPTPSGTAVLEAE